MAVEEEGEAWIRFQRLGEVLVYAEREKPLLLQEQRREFSAEL